MNETCKPIEELKEVLKEFMEIQIGINDAVNEDFEDLTKELTERDKDITYMITDLHHRVIAIEDNKLNDLNNDHIEKLEEKITELDHDTTTVLKDLIRRVMILEEKVKHYESQNIREDINKINDKMIRINKKHTTEINDVQHRLNIIERERRRNNASNK